MNVPTTSLAGATRPVGGRARARALRRSPPGLGLGPVQLRARTRTARWVLGSAMAATGLMAGLFYSYSVSVMVGLAKTDDRTFVSAMQRINQGIQNAAFFPAFYGAFLLPAASAVLHRRLGLRDAARWTVAGAALYAVALAVTFGINIPLNDRLDRAGDVDRIADLAALRADFERPWVAWNIVRTVLSTAALGCVGRALMLHRDADAVPA